MAQELLIATAFPLHLSLWFVYRNYYPRKNIFAEEEEIFVEYSMPMKDDLLNDSRPFHKSDSEYSLGLNRSESIAFNLNQFGKPCFMQHSPVELVKMLFYENANMETAFIAGSFAVIYYHFILNNYFNKN